MERNDRLSLPWNKLYWQGPDGRLSLLRRSSQREQPSPVNKGIHKVLNRFVRLPKLFFLFIKNERWNKVSWKGSNRRLCSLFGRSRHREQSSKKGKHIIFKRYLRRAKIFLFLKNEQQDKRYYDDTNVQNNGIRYINWIVKLQNEFSISIDGQNNNDKEDHVEESSLNKKASVKLRDVPEGGADRCSKLETQKSVCPNLSSINSTNFRVRLYHQLNVVGRRSKLPSHLYSSPPNSNSQRGSGYKARIHHEFERSKPIAMTKGRMIDCDDGFCDRQWAVSPSSRLDNEDIFALDM